MSVFESPFHSLHLQRIPIRQRETLQAWDAADEYLLQHVSDAQPDSNANVLICNDAFGALSLNLIEYSPSLYTDSHIAELALTHNARKNNLQTPAIQVIPSTEKPAGSWDLVLIKLPRNQAWFQEQLIQIKPHLHDASKVVVAAMVKHLPHSAMEQVERIIGPAVLSRAKKKARLILAEHDSSRVLPPSKYPKHWSVDAVGAAGKRIELINYANTFSKDSLDIGARFFLQHLPEGLSGHIIDLGCGNGVIGIAAALKNHGSITFVDESHMAVASAQASWQCNGLDDSRAGFRVNDGLSGFDEDSADCVLCNPPFHQQNTVGDQIARGLFRDAHRVLKAGGELRIIGNRHLGYHILLKRLFGNCEVVASNKKFVILSSRK